MITKEQVNQARQDAIDSREKFDKIQREFAIQECPFSVGDVIDCLGYSHKGKKMVVTGIGSARHSFAGDWRVIGDVLRKDGTPGKLYTDFSHTQYRSAQQDAEQ